MARKKPSTHSDAQFALFVQQIKGMLDGEAGSDFDDIVRRLVVAAKRGSLPTDPRKGSDDLQASEAEPASPASLAMPLGNLPDPPDFDALEAAAREAGATRANLMVLIGQLVLGSSNNESLLIYVLMVLLETDEPSAATVFSTLNTTRARLDLVSRLAQIKIGDLETRAALDQVVKHFNEANQVRNEFLHAMYTVDGKGVITHTQTMRLIVKGSRTSFGEQIPIDQKRLDGMVTACRDLRSLNRKIWELLPRLQDAIANTNSKRAVAAKTGQTAHKGRPLDADGSGG
jgi:hypothetical protein